MRSGREILDSFALPWVRRVPSETRSVPGVRSVWPWVVVCCVGGLGEGDCPDDEREQGEGSGDSHVMWMMA